MQYSKIIFVLMYHYNYFCNKKNMAIEIAGTLITLLPEQSGTGINGNWVKQDFVIETEDQYPKKVCFSAWGDKASLIKNISVGTKIKVSFSPESREFNGKWYTDLRAWRIEQNILKPNTEFSNVPPPESNDEIYTEKNQTDDLPF
jgi:hypothetical protein